ncbi:hypothetical protein BUALT_Bualt15G0007600 [Buddleja alternifolia]|uniref:Uncharacterized protein n=1 Tax=Buddleja alternifolia TaxID=168488 RepID=A0AAV6WGW7_9LAMI|nr:hypothetical protein BUALT_Bualt15G0007600 [Buddleja alternifolia]
MTEERRVDPDCRNASNPHHKCTDFCFKIIAEAKAKINQKDEGLQANDDNVQLNMLAAPNYREEVNDGSYRCDYHYVEEAGLDGNNDNEARKANQWSREGLPFKQWLKERNKQFGRPLDANGLDMSKAYMLDAQETTESKYKKLEKEPVPSG